MDAIARAIKKNWHISNNVELNQKTWDDFDKDDHFLRCIKKVLEISSEVYEFNALEKQAAPLLYRCIKPLYWNSTDLLKDAGEDDEKIQVCLDFIEYEQTREIDFWNFGKMEL